MLYIGVYGNIDIVAVNMPSPAEVSAERRTCAEVLHSLSKGDETGEWAQDVISCE